jgi:hypothetical protein
MKKIVAALFARFFPRTIFKTIISTFIIGFWGSCSQKDFFIRDNKTIVTLIPPNAIAINDTLYCDKTEIGILDYREYQYWIETTYGIDSEKYRSTIIDNERAVRDFLDSAKISSDSVLLMKIGHVYGSNSFAEAYFMHPKYMYYPVVGLSYKQAQDYTKWRSNVVYEGMLIKRGLIGYHHKRDSLNCFTIEKYLAGQFFNYTPSKKVPIPRFRLPTIEEWELIAQIHGGDDWGIDFNNKEVRKYQSKSSAFFLTKDYLISSKYLEKKKHEASKEIIPFTSNAESFFSYKDKVFHLIGNVAEMTNTEGIAKGGSWYHLKEESKIKNNIHYTKPTLWLGMRCVCTWEILK